MENKPDFDLEFRAKFDDLLRWRRDVRHFRSDPLSDADVIAVVERACLAPSVGNSQPWRFVRVRSASKREVIARHVDEAKKDAGGIYDGDIRKNYDRMKLHGIADAPELMAVFCDEETQVGHGLGKQTMPETLHYSVVISIHCLWLAARARGIGVGWVSIVKPEIFPTLLDLPKTWTFVGLLCLGWPVEESDSPELVQNGWQDRLSPETLLFDR